MIKHYEYRYNLRCRECGRFVSTKDKEGIVYTPYGSYYDIEMPDERYICGECYSGFSEEHKRLIADIAYIGPDRICDEDV